MLPANEAATRRDLIDPQLQRAGWDVANPNQVGLEIPVDGYDPAAWHALNTQLRQIREANQLYEVALPAGISDYALYRANGEIIAVVEAKKASYDSRLAQAQASFYVQQIGKRQSFQPFAFTSNGVDTYFLDPGSAAPRLVAGFFSPADLDILLYLRQNKQPLAAQPINNSITNRSYQHEAIRRACEAFDAGKRKVLLVMATGTGKTRTAMSLVDLFLRANQARRILFIADRDELVKQALNDGFKAHLPHEPATRIIGGKVDLAKPSRLFVATLQTISSCFEQFTPGFFDLIIFDEVHRSIFNKWSDVLHYFDARMVGLTATPADFINRDTFLAFDCTDGTPTYLYTYEQAIADKMLVDFDLRVAQTRFQRQGIKGLDLNEEARNMLIEQGHDPDAIDFKGTELERTVSNKDTLRKQWEEIMGENGLIRDESGQLPGKTIVFAMTQKHALRLADTFNEMYPQYHDLVRVITADTNFKGQPLDQFKKQSLPRIAITVDLLETGVDVPEVVNLVFMKPVQSRIKLTQMIGRGTRDHETCRHTTWLPNGRKTEFLVIDFWENDFNKSPEAERAQSLPVLVTIFNTRLTLLETFGLANQAAADFQRTVAALRRQIADIPTDAFTIKKLMPSIGRAWDDTFWQHLTADKLAFLRLQVAPLLRYASAGDIAAATFTSKVERLKLQIAGGKDASAIARDIADDVSLLPPFVQNDPASQPAIAFCYSVQLAQATPAQLDDLIAALAGQMKVRMKEQSTLLLDLGDVIAHSGYLWLRGGTEQVYVSEYKKRVDQRIIELIDTHPAIAALAGGEALDDPQLLALERTLQHDLAAGDLELTESNVRKVYGYKVGSLLEFVRQVWELSGVPDYADVVRRQFEALITEQQFNGDQVRFLRALRDVFISRRRLRRNDLYAEPMDAFGMDAADRYFSASQQAQILDFVTTLTVIGE
jgi:type I restriction enzyme R subunit